jgi:hypothetical protein
MDVHMKIFVEFQHAFKNTVLFFYRLRRNFKLIFNFNFIDLPIALVKFAE